MLQDGSAGGCPGGSNQIQRLTLEPLRFHESLSSNVHASEIGKADGDLAIVAAGAFAKDRERSQLQLLGAIQLVAVLQNLGEIVQRHRSPDVFLPVGFL